MPRQTTSLQGGPRTAGHDPITPQLQFFAVSLLKFIIEATPDNRFVYDKSRSTSTKRFSLHVGFDINHSCRFVTQIKDETNKTYFDAAIPCANTDLEVRLFENTYVIDIRHFKKNTQVLVSRWTFYLEVSNPSIAGRVKKGWNSLSKRLRNMSIGQLRYLNIPRSLQLLEESSSSQDRHAFRQQQRSIAQSHSGPSVVMIEVPRLDIKMVYTGTIASPGFQALVDWVEFKRKPAINRPTTDTVPRLTEEEQDDPVAVEERARQLRKLANDSNTVCGQCYQTGVPVEPGKIRARRDRKEWIGCQNAESCKSHNFWFHLTEDCAGFTSVRAPKKMRWWCIECRKERPGTDDLGLESRPGAR